MKITNNFKSKLQTYLVKPIPGTNGNYFITKDGIVLSNRSGAFKLLRVGFNLRTMRPQVHIGRSIKPIHRLVALTYIPNPKHLPCVCHKDNDRTNNKVTNLYWGTQKDNMNQCVNDNRLRPQGKIPNSKEIIKLIKHDYLRGLSNRKLCMKYDISVSTIHRYTKDIPKKTGSINKLSKDDIINMLKDYDTGKYSYKALGIKYHIGHTSVGNYIRKYNK